MIGKTILLGVLMVSIVFAITSVKSAVSQKLPLWMSLVPIGFTSALGIGVLLVYLGI